MALKPAVHGRDHCPGGADPIPCFNHEWVCVDTGDLSFESDGTTGTTVEWYRYFESTGASNFFTYEELGAGTFDDKIGLKMLSSGVYTYSWHALTTDIDNTGGVTVQVDCQITDEFGVNDPFPGRIGTNESFTEIIHVPDDAGIVGDDLGITRSITLPVICSGTANIGEMTMQYNQAVPIPWFVRLWVVRHGAVGWEATNFNNPTWPE